MAAPAKDAAYALVQFEGKEGLYRLRFTFQASDEYLASQGPPVTHIAVEPATAAVLAQISNPSCPPPAVAAQQ